ncbi:MAG: homoaconitase [Planctomycetes bacterium]|nr:homoaconitase [Planctomycetota bacterium]MCP4771951.1 homoaconitase [Planctomycetota bacterium]MCP4860398.1 homoaconitase [Planctomycetota bacterium]
MTQNRIEKIVQAFAEDLAPNQKVFSGDFVTVRPRHVMTHDNTAAVMMKYQTLGAKSFNNPRQAVFTLDHNVQDRSDDNLNKYASIGAFAQENSVDFHPAGRGIGHQVMIEEGYAWPGSLVVASDSHSNTYGGIGALGTPVVRTDAAALWATGRTWWQIPPVTRIELHGALKPSVSGKDLIITLCGLYNHDEVLNHALEFHGDGVASLSIDERLTIANMTTEWGALTGVFPCDATTVVWYRERLGKSSRIDEDAIAKLERNPLEADAQANYAQVIHVDLGSINSMVCGPDGVKVMHSADSMAEQKIKVHKAYLLSCTNGRASDLTAAARVLNGKKIASHVELYIAAASDQVQADSEANGDWQKLLDAGAKVLPAGCGPCIGMGAGLLEDGEVGISATNRNFKGRMGSREAQAYLASPAVVAASALAGYICAPDLTGEDLPPAKVETPEQAPRESTSVPILDGFPTEVEGRIVFCNSDNLNTDGIYPGKYTYREDMSPKQMAEVAMENYDDIFQQVAQEGDIVVSGFNFGTGSSREQAATALKYRGIDLVIGGSFSATYKRNAFNNGYLLVDCPDLVEHLRASGFGLQSTERLEQSVKLDFATGVAVVEDQRFAFAPLGPTAQELIIAGGLEPLVAGQLA